VLFGYIVDPDTGKIVAVIRHGEVFRNDNEGARIAIVLNANLCDLNGNLVGRLDEQNMIDVKTWSMPIAFRNLLQGADPRATEKPAAGSLTVNGLCAGSPNLGSERKRPRHEVVSVLRGDVSGE
jgi:hypothetical protein